MDIVARILSPWIGSGVPGTDPYRAKFRDDFPGVAYSDITGTEPIKLIPPVNGIVLEVRTNDTKLSEISAKEYPIIFWEQDESSLAE